MAGEKIEVIKGPATTIRAVADENAAAGDLERIGLTYGFWLHDVAKGAEGDFCISAPIIEIPSNSKMHIAGTLVQLTGNDPNITITYGANTAQATSRNVAVRYMVVYRRVRARDTRMLVTWGIY